MAKIKSVVAREILDSRQKPTLEVELETDKGVFLASVPSGASTGKNEALELRDADGKGVQAAIENVNEIIGPKLKNLNPENQQEIDKLMINLDGTENKSKLGANAILGVSIAVCRAGAGAKKMPLYKHIAEISGNKLPLKIPLGMFNILNGGRHVSTLSGSEGHLDLQEFMVVPHKKTMAENMVLINDVFLKLKELIKKNFGEGHLGLGDEGGFAPPVKTAEQALYLLKSACEGHKEINFALDCAASEFFSPSASSVGKYKLEGRELSRHELLDFYKGLATAFSIISIEDPFAEEDWEGFKEITKDLANLQIVGDDLTTTNIKRIKEAHNKQACNAVILKLNQIGTVSETIEASKLAKSFQWKTIVSHRSGETMDNFIADLAVGMGADFLKAGSPAKDERMVKYNRLLQIENEI